MTSRNYKVNRDDIYVGLLNKTDVDKIVLWPKGLYRLSKGTRTEIASGLITLEDALRERDLEFLHKPHEISPGPKIKVMERLSAGNGTRRGLFVIDSNNCANDLLYDCPNYPIFNISSHELCFSEEFSYKQAYRIDGILRYFDEPDLLTLEDIIRISEYYFGDFLYDNCELFGVREDTKDGCTGYQAFDSKGNLRTFNDRFKGAPIPEAYFYSLWRVRDFSFDPIKEERNIKALRLR